MIEWNDRNKYKAFNSYKGLAYIDHYRKIVDWFNGAKYLPPPIEAGIDLAHECNYRCPHCNSQRYLWINRDEIPAERRIIPLDHLKKLSDFLIQWGVKAICFGGGGEPLINPAVKDIIPYIANKGIEMAMESNGSLITPELAEILCMLKWIGISVDAGDRETFNRIHGLSEDSDMFNQVIKNIGLLVTAKYFNKSPIDICYKVLLTPYNVHSVVDACKAAKWLGVRDFHIRPADLDRPDIVKPDRWYFFNQVNDVFQECHEMEDENFRVFTPTHKFSPTLRGRCNFSRCWSSTLLIPCCSSGSAYVCLDRRMETGYELASHYPDPYNIERYWGSNTHREQLLGIDVKTACTRCTLGEYARQIEEVVVTDNMMLNFP